MAQPQTIMLSLNFVISILLHLNISSLLFQMDEFTNLLSALTSNFKIIGITEADKGGALLYISKEIN